MDVWDYFHHRERDFSDYSVRPDRPMFEASEDGTSGRMFGHLDLGDGAYLSVFERVVVEEGKRFVVTKYAYRLVVDGQHVIGWDKNVDYHESIVTHRHVGPAETREPHGEITLRDALGRAWHYVETIASFGEPDDQAS